MKTINMKIKLPKQRDIVYNAYIASRPHANWTPSKKGKQAKMENKYKHKMLEY